MQIYSGLKFGGAVKNNVKRVTTLACQMLHYSIFLYFYSIVFIAIVYFLFVSNLYSLLLHILIFVFNICSFLLYVFRFYSLFDHLYSISVYFYCICFVFILYSVICI